MGCRELQISCDLSQLSKYCFKVPANVNETGRLNKQLRFRCVANILKKVSDFKILKHSDFVISSGSHFQEV